MSEFLSMAFFFFSYCCTSLYLSGCSACLTWVRHDSRKSSGTHSCQCVQCFCVYSVYSVQTMVWLPAMGIFNVRADGVLYKHRKRVCTES